MPITHSLPNQGLRDFILNFGSCFYALCICDFFLHFDLIHGSAKNVELRTPWLIHIHYSFLLFFEVGPTNSDGAVC